MLNASDTSGLELFTVKPGRSRSARDRVRPIMLRSVLHVVGARPNFMKMGPLIDALATEPDGYEHLLVHTGQHYDPSLSDVFFTELQLPKPDVWLGVGSGSHAEQTAKVNAPRAKGSGALPSQHTASQPGATKREASQILAK